MQKMLIRTDEGKIKELGIDRDELQRNIDYAFRLGHFFVDTLLDGSVLYTGNPKFDNYLGFFGAAYVLLSRNKNFMSVCDKWIWYSNENNEKAIYEEDDVLKGIAEDEESD